MKCHSRVFQRGTYQQTAPAKVVDRDGGRQFNEVKSEFMLCKSVGSEFLQQKNS